MEDVQLLPVNTWEVWVNDETYRKHHARGVRYEVAHYDSKRNEWHCFGLVQAPKDLIPGPLRPRKGNEDADTSMES